MRIEDLNPNQQQAVLHFDSPCLVLAGAGSGKCIIGKSIIPTNKGLLEIHDIPNHFNISENQCEAQVLSYSLDGKRNILSTSHWFDMGESDVVNIETTSGYSIGGTLEHPVVVLNRVGNLEFKTLNAVEIGEFIVLSKNNEIWSSNDLIDSELSSFMGLLVADGYLNKNDGLISFSNSVPEVISEYFNLASKLFGIDNINSRPKSDSDTIDHDFYSVEIKERLRSLGLKMVVAQYKEIPFSVLQSTRSTVISFLRSYFDLESNVNEGSIEVSSASRRLLEQIQIVLLNLGIRSSLRDKLVKSYPSNDYFRLHISGIAARIFRDKIGYNLNKVAKCKLDELCSKPINTNVEVYPFQSDRLKRIRSYRLVGNPFWNGRKQSLPFGSIKDYLSGRRNPSEAKINQIIEYTGVDSSDCEYLDLIAKNLIFEKIRSKSFTRERVFDFTVPENHSFVANGFINHNTRVITNKIVHIVGDRNVDLDRILAITFTNKAAKEMSNRVVDALNLDVPPPWITTFHSMGAKILRFDAPFVGYERDFVIYDQAESEKLLKMVLVALKLTSDIYEVAPIREAISQVKQSLNPKLIDYFDREIPLFKGIFAAYIKVLRACNAVDFDDLLGLIYKLFRTTPEVLEKWQNRFDYFLVDEFQDTNRAQHEVFKFLVGENRNITAVGDPFQCIYEWRGAKPENILKFEEEFPGSTIIKLERNYRSTKNILNAANVVISKCTGLYKKKVLTLHTENDQGEEIYLREFYDRSKEAQHVASEISKLKVLNHYKWSDFAILVRLTFLTRHIEEALLRFRIPYQVIGGLKFGQRKEIRDLISYLAVIHNPKDQVAFERIVNVPSRGMGPAALEKVKEQPHESWIEKLRSALPTLGKKARESCEKLVNAMDFVAARANQHPHDALSYIANSVGYEQYLKDKFKGESFDRISNVKELLAILKTVQTQNKTLSEWLEESKLVSDQDNIDEKDTLKIMTIHAAKGLEFPVVYLPGLEEGILPCKMAYTPDELEEERRLFYVAITRPKDILRLSYAVTEFGNDFQTKSTTPSRYLKDITDHVKLI